MEANKKVAIVGSGLIGRQWAMIFASHDYKVQLYDTNADCLSRVSELIKRELTDQFEKGCSRGSLTLERQLANITTASSLADCLKAACHVQECVFENLDLKRAVFEQIDELLGDDNTEASICSSTSVNLPSSLFDKVKKHRQQCLVAHPINPPLYVKLVELIPMAETREQVVIRTRLTMDEVGQKPVVLRKEVSGFALNRLQYAVFQEAFRLIHEGVMTPDDVDTVVSDGLGPRYAFMGPWMTAHLNAVGMPDYLARYGEGIYKVSLDCQPILKLEGEAAQQIIDSMLHQVPIQKLDEKRAWRDKCLVELAKIKDKIQNE